MAPQPEHGREHDRIVAGAGVSHLLRVLEPYRIMHRDAFRHAAGTAGWHEGSFDAALASAVSTGVIERLPGDFYRIPGYDDTASGEGRGARTPPPPFIG